MFNAKFAHTRILVLNFFLPTTVDCPILRRMSNPKFLIPNKKKKEKKRKKRAKLVEPDSGLTLEEAATL